MDALVEDVVDRCGGYWAHTAGRFRNATGQIGGREGGKGVDRAISRHQSRAQQTVGWRFGCYETERLEGNLLNVWNVVK